jgi:chorismate synthase
VPAGWGAPLYGKLDAELAAALMSINAAKGVEIGEGFASAALTGEENADEMRMGNDGPVFLSNTPAASWAGMSTGQPVTARVAFKPTSSILTPRRASTRPARRSTCAPRAATTPAWASAACRWSRP